AQASASRGRAGGRAELGSAGHVKSASGRAQLRHRTEVAALARRVERAHDFFHRFLAGHIDIPWIAIEHSRSRQNRAGQSMPFLRIIPRGAPHLATRVKAWSEELTSGSVHD